MASITNTQVFGLNESLIRSGYPMLTVTPTPDEFDLALWNIQNSADNNAYITRGQSLANADGGGHDQFLTGVTVTADWTLSNKAWVEAERYRFLNFISSQSTMHRVTRMDFARVCNGYVDLEIIIIITRLREAYERAKGKHEKREAMLRLLYNLPSGLELTAGIVTNYRCLKNIYRQRRNHRLPDWGVVCDWIEKLPQAKRLITGKERSHHDNTTNT
jgi:hypothetical protein